MAKKATRKHTPPRRSRFTYDEEGRVVGYQLTPEEWESVRKQQVEADRVRRSIDRSLAIRDNLIPPPWASAKAASPTQAEPQQQRRHGLKWTRVEIAALQQEYQDYRQAHPEARLADVDDHLVKWSKQKFGKAAHADTIRDHVRKPVDASGKIGSKLSR